MADLEAPTTAVEHGATRIMGLLSGGGEAALAVTRDDDDDLTGRLDVETDAPPDTESEAATGETPPADDAAPPAAEPSGEDGAVEPEPTAPPIDPPNSWSDDEKAEFRKLPPVLQQTLSKRERERDVAVRRSQNEAAQIRQAYEAEKGTIEQARNHFLARANEYVDTRIKAFEADFADIKTPQDVVKLSGDDPLRYGQWNARLHEIQQAQQERNAAAQQARDDFEARKAQHVHRQHQLLIEKLPEFAEKAKAEKLGLEIRGYLRESGFADPEIDDANDHRMILIARKAMLYDRIQAARPATPVTQKKVQAEPPKAVLKPGNPDAVKPASREREERAISRLQKTGSVHDAAAAIFARQRG